MKKFLKAVYDNMEQIGLLIISYIMFGAGMLAGFQQDNASLVFGSTLCMLFITWIMYELRAVK